MISGRTGKVVLYSKAEVAFIAILSLDTNVIYTRWGHANRSIVGFAFVDERTRPLYRFVDERHEFIRE